MDDRETLLDISALSRYQIDRFFLKNISVTLEQCNAMAQEITGQDVTPTGSQGMSSYTVEGGELVVQFRETASALDMNLLQSIESAYADFVPHHQYRGQLDQVHVYVMNNVGGLCMYQARAELWANNCSFLRVAIDDYARFFASAYHNTPNTMTRPDSKLLLDKYMSQLQQLREELPDRFRAKLDELVPQVPDLFTDDWPLVPNHTDLLENNIHVDTATGKILGICDWRDVEVSPFGMSLWGLETMVGVVTRGSWWKYHLNHQELRDQFWTTFYHHLGDVSDAQKRRIEVARSIGLFLYSGVEYDCPAPDGNYQLGGLVVD